MSLGTLNVDTRYNILLLSPKFHRAFDANEWLLLPEPRIVEAYYNARKTRELPKIDAKVYKYTLIAHEGMRQIPIHRQKDPPPDPPMQPPAEDFTYHPYPYHGFPTIESHVHPRFIICNSGSKLDHGMVKWFKGNEMKTVLDDLAMVYDIWNTWKGLVPTKEFFTKTSKRGDLDIRDDNSQKTASYRVLLSTRPDGGEWLDDETLHKFDRQTSSQHDHKIPKNHQIREWLRSFSGSKCVAEVQGELESDGNSDDAMTGGGGMLLS